MNFNNQDRYGHVILSGAKNPCADVILSGAKNPN